MLNDVQVAGGRVYTDAMLLNHAINAYDWFVLSLADYVKVDFRKRVEDLTYTANEDTLSNLAAWPADLWLPEVIYFRKTVNDEYYELGRVDDIHAPLPSGRSNTRLSEWSFINRKIKTIPATEAGLLKIVYLAILPELTGASSPLLVDFAVPAMAYYTASEGEDVRGGSETSAVWMAKAEGFMGKIVNLHVKNEQYTNRRGKPEHGIPSHGQYGNLN